MTKIPSGFKVRPYDGAIDEGELLCRYIKTRYLEQLLSKGFWFTATYVWKDGDACEASLIPSFKKLLIKDLRNEAEYLFLSSMIEVDLKSDYGCCFSQYSIGENDGMWRAYTPEPDYGVIVVIKAQSLYKSMQNQLNLIKNQYLKKVTYLSDKQARNMSPTKCKHQNLGADATYDFTECHYYKRAAFNYEREVRAVLRPEALWPLIFHQFINDHKILYLPISFPTPTDKPYYRIDMRKSMDYISPSDLCVLLSVEQAKELTQEVSSYLERNVMAKGIYVPFDFNNIEEIMIHPALKEVDSNYLNLRGLLSNYNLFNRTRRSKLYEEGW